MLSPVPFPYKIKIINTIIFVFYLILPILLYYLYSDFYTDFIVAIINTSTVKFGISTFFLFPYEAIFMICISIFLLYKYANYLKKIKINFIYTALKKISDLFFRAFIKKTWVIGIIVFFIGSFVLMTIFERVFILFPDYAVSYFPKKAMELINYKYCYSYKDSQWHSVRHSNYYFTFSYKNNLCPTVMQAESVIFDNIKK